MHSLRWIALPRRREDGHEALGKGPFSEHASEEVRNLERHIEGVGRGLGPEQLSEHHIPQQPQHPGEAGHGTHDRRTAPQASLRLTVHGLHPSRATVLPSLASYTLTRPQAIGILPRLSSNARDSEIPRGEYCNC